MAWLDHYHDCLGSGSKMSILDGQTLEELDNTIKELQDKIEIYNKPTEEEIEAYKARAGKEFDAKHGLHLLKGDRNNRNDRERDAGHDRDRERGQHKKVVYKEKGKNNTDKVQDAQHSEHEDD